MSPAVEKMLSEFDLLSSTEKQEAIREVLRRSLAASEKPISEASLILLADERFQALDAEELNEESPAR